MKNDFESGYCTAPRCRTFLPNGSGQQVQNQDGTLDRFCPRHMHEYNLNLELAAEEFRRQNGEKATQGLLFGAALGILVVLFAFSQMLR